MTVESFGGTIQRGTDGMGLKDNPLTESDMISQLCLDCPDQAVQQDPLDLIY